MNCPACAHENRPGARFCEACAAPLERACASCGAQLRPSAKFCDACGAALGAPVAARPAEAAGSRKVVAIVFADLVGSTALHERLDLESARRFMEDYYAAMRAAVEAHGGTVTQLLGDGVKAVFGMPRVAEDDAIRAVRAAVAMQQAFRALAEAQRGAVGKTGLRVAVNSGEVVASDASEIIGDPVNVAARLQEQGRDGDVVIGEATQRLVSALVTVEALGSFALKGRSESVKAYRVISLERPAGAAATAFVGRDDELARITAVYETALARPATALAVLLGSPGLGKSRLIEELARRLGDGATLIRAHCDASGGASFAPLADAMRALPDLEAAVPGSDAERARILAGVRALLAGSPASPEETFFVVRRLLSALAAAKPVVLVIDDLHWAEPLLLDLVEHLVQWGSGVRLLVLVGARPELRERRSTLAAPGGLVAEVLNLTGLDAGAAMRLAANVIGAADLPAAVAAKVLATSEGNPLFVGELVRMLVHEGALRREGERWTAGTALAALEMPPTIGALLAARIERLRPEERGVLERAAVIGRHFSRSAVAELLGRDAADLDAQLESLRRSELIERDTSWFFGEPALRFHHVLIRDAAYRRILKGTRAELHARFAAWIEARAGDSLEHDEAIGWHLEQAHQHLRELGPIDARGRALGERAAARLAAAGRRALARDDVPLAAGLLGRALDRLDRDDAARAELALDWCEALLAAGDVGPASAALEELDRFAAGDARLRAWHTCFAGQLTSLTAPQGLVEAADAVAKAASELAALGDVAGEAKAHFVHAQAFARLGKVGACEAALDLALAAARRAGDRRRANTVLAIAPLAALWGPSPVTRASGRCLDVVRVLRITQGAPAVEAVALSCQGVLEALRGRTDAARRMIASARKMVEELGITQRLLEADVFAARIDLLDGDAAAAERGLRTAYEGLRELGLGIDAARAAALLARALLAQGRAGEAEALTHASEQLAGDDLQAAIAWRGARAEALARRGDTVEAVALASKAVEIAAATDALLDHADARLALAAALRAANRTREADAEERRATELWDAKGATLLAERARREGPPVARAELPLESRSAPARPARLAPRANAVTASVARFEAAASERDISALEHLFSDPCVVVHHLTGRTYDRRVQLTTWKSMLRAEHFTYRPVVLATLGESLALTRERISIGGFREQALASFGAVELEQFYLGEVGADGGLVRIELFAADQLGPAIARLYERHAELRPEGPERERAAATAHSARVMLGQPDLASTASVLAPDVEFSDLRTVGFGTLRGAAAVLETIAAMMQLSRDDSAHIEDVLVLEPDALVVRWTNRGTQVASGGAFERNLCQLFAFDSGGKLSRWQQFEVEHDAEALARFEELTAARARASTDASAGRVQPNAAAAPQRFENAASRADRELLRCFNTRDWQGVLACTAPELVFDERRRLLRNTCGRDVWLEQFRLMFDLPASRFTSLLLATRGERLSLHLHLFEGEVAGGGGPLAMDDHYALHEVDPSGRIVAIVLFDEHERAAADAEIDARFDAGEGAAHARALASSRAEERAWANRDWEVFAALAAPEFAFRDHRLLGWGTTMSDVSSMLRILRALTDLAPDTRSRLDHLRVAERAYLRQITQLGTRDGGAFENVLLLVAALDDEGRLRANDAYDAEQSDRALARFEELARRAADRPAEPFANAASRAVERGTGRLWAARDWDGIVAGISPAMRMDDRRRITRLEIGYEDFIAQLRMLFDQPGSRWREPLLATRGDRLALHRTIFEAEVAGGGGPLAFDEHLSVTELGADGRWIASVTFDLDDLEAAYAELDRRYEAGEDKAHAVHATIMRPFARAFETRNWTPLLALCAPNVVEHDNRGLAVLGTTRGAEAWLENFRMLGELAPDSRYRVDHFRSSARGLCSVGVWHGTREGGPYELPLVAVLELDARKRIVRGDIFDADQLERARARFDELEPAASPPPRFENAATRTVARAIAAQGARDWQRFGTYFAPEFRNYDRRALIQLETDREQFLASHRQIIEMTTSLPTRQVLATRGDRLAIVRLGWQGADGDVGPSEIDWLIVVEMDERGDHVAAVTFDPHDLDAAYAELDARWQAGEGALHPRAASWLQDFAASRQHRDAETRAELFAPALVARDHRLVGWGTLHGPEVFLETLRHLSELAPDVAFRLDHVRMTRRGTLAEGAWLGTRDGGAFESPLVSVVELDADGRAVFLDLYDPHHFEAALARFEALRPDPLRIPPNAAVRAIERVAPKMAAVDTAALRAVVSDDFVFDDRSRRALLRGGVEEWLRALQFLRTETRAQLQARLVATAGERLALHHVVWREPPGTSSFEIENYRLIEIDAAGKLRALLVFEADDREAAGAELYARWVAGGAGGAPAGMIEFARAMNDRDLARVRAALPADFVLDDHRRTGIGRIEGGDAYVASLAAVFELSHRSRWETLYYLATAPHGAVSVNRLSGTNAEGGEFESCFVSLARYEGDRFQAAEMFELEDLDAALARFEALRPEPSHIPPNAATRARER